MQDNFPHKVLIERDGKIDESEIWLPIEKYPGFEISSLGRVITSNYRRSNKPQFLKICSRLSYESVSIRYNGKNKNIFVHRLLAQAFVPNPDNKPNINHINGIRSDNRLENLEWCTQKENIQHAVRTGLLKNFKRGSGHPASKKIIDISTGQIFGSIRDAAEFLNIDQKLLSGRLRGVTPNRTKLRYYEEK